MKLSSLRGKSWRPVSFFITLACLTSSNSFGNGAIDRNNFGIFTNAAPVCTATITAIDFQPDLGQIRVDIHELCNVSNGYDLEIMHDGIGIDRMSYDNVELQYSADTSTILANRRGAYHGRRVLLIETSGSIVPDIKGLRVRQVSGLNTKTRI